MATCPNGLGFRVLGLPRLLISTQVGVGKSHMRICLNTHAATLMEEILHHWGSLSTGIPGNYWTAGFFPSTVVGSEFGILCLSPRAARNLTLELLCTISKGCMLGQYWENGKMEATA